MLIATALLLGPVIGLELGVRALADTGRLPLAPSSNQLTDISFANARREGKADVLVLGASAIRDGIKPGTIERLVREATGSEIRVRTVGQANVNFDSQAMLARALAAEDLLPDTVILGLTPHMLWGETAAGVDWLQRSDLGRLLAGCGGLSDLLDLGTYDCLLAERSTAWRWHGRPDRLIDAVTDGMPRSLELHRRTMTPSGWVSGEPSDANRLGRQTPGFAGRLGESVVVSDAAVADFEGLVSDLRERGSAVIVVEMPYWADLDAGLEEQNPGWHEAVRVAYEDLAGAASVDLVGVDGFEDRAEPEWFRDPRHLSRVGAARFTRALWGDPDFREPVLEGLGLGG